MTIIKTNPDVANMTSAERGRSMGYGGIWCDATFPEGMEPEIPDWKYESVDERDEEDRWYPWESEEVKEEKYQRGKKKYFIHGTHLYKLVNPNGILHPWMNGVDPIQ